MGSQAPTAPAFSLAPQPWEAGKLSLRPAHFPCKGGLEELLFAWTGSHGEQASPCPCRCPLSQWRRWAQGEAGQSLAELGESLGAGLGDKTGGGSRSLERAVAAAAGLLAPSPPSGGEQWEAEAGGGSASAAEPLPSARRRRG